MKTISIYELRDNLAEYLGKVSETRISVVVERYNKPLAIITPYKPTTAYEDIDTLFGFLENGKEDGVSFVQRVRRNKTEKKRVKMLLNHT